MKRFALSLAALTLALAACTPQTTAPRLARVAFETEDAMLQIGEATRLPLLTQDAGGQNVEAQVTLTSSDPSIVSVLPDGRVRAERLTPAGTTVTLTARSGALRDTLEISTYGLEVTAGTFNTPGEPLGTAILTRFRAPEGMEPGQYETVRVTAPSGTEVFPGNFFAGTRSAGDVHANLAFGPEVPELGEYAATVTHSGVTYRDTDRQDSLTPAAPPTGVTLEVTKTNYRLNATLTDNPEIAGALKGGGVTRLFGLANASTLPLAATFVTPPAPGTYQAGVYTFPVRLDDLTATPLTAFDVTYTPTGTVVIE